jgi:hypothetical protein
MDFLSHFGFSIVPPEQQVLHAAQAASSPRQCFWTDRRCHRRSPAPSTAVAQGILDAVAAQCCHSQAYSRRHPPHQHGGWIQRSTVSPKRSSLHLRKQVLFAIPTRPGHLLCICCPKRMAPGAPAATTAASALSQCPTGTPCATCSPSMTAWLVAPFFRKIDLVKAYHQIPICL